MKRIARIAAAAIFVALIPLLLITSSVRFVINLPALYSYGFDRYDIAEYTRIERDDLIAAGKQFRDYFNNDDEDLIIRTYVGGVLVESLYNAREIHHMRDVKALVRGVYLVQMLTLLYIATYIVVGFWLRRAEFWGMLGRDVSRGGKLTLVLVVVVGLLALVGFNQLFLLFHLISFSNDFWMLDPRHDYLIAMFPQGVFFDATMFIAFCTIAAAAVLAAAPRIGRIVARGFHITH
ncbi:MAG: TIGR01906 family membrane protein [Chloroflexi bacterium]|nr:TIGR01906 family membrane protein [Chloroflexota bacterium]